MRAQWGAKQPLIKQLWKRVVIAKITMQAAALDAFGQASEPVRQLVRAVRSGDEGNVEAQAARRYWPLMMGKDFHRDQNSDGTNALLNYGYTVLRAFPFIHEAYPAALKKFQHSSGVKRSQISPMASMS